MGDVVTGTMLHLEHRSSVSTKSLEISSPLWMEHWEAPPVVKSPKKCVVGGGRGVCTASGEGQLRGKRHGSPEASVRKRVGDLGSAGYYFVTLHLYCITPSCMTSCREGLQLANKLRLVLSSSRHFQVLRVQVCAVHLASYSKHFREIFKKSINSRFYKNCKPQETINNYWRYLPNEREIAFKILCQ